MQFVGSYSKFVGTSAVNFCLQGTQVYIEINIIFSFNIIIIATIIQYKDSKYNTLWNARRTV